VGKRTVNKSIDDGGVRGIRFLRTGSKIRFLGAENRESSGEVPGGDKKQFDFNTHHARKTTYQNVN